MKRIIAFALCAILMVCAFSVVAFAEGEQPDVIVQRTVDAEEKTIAETVVDYFKDHLEEISVIVTLILTVIYNARKHGLLNKSIGTLNNNAVTVAENSSSVIKEALEKMNGVSEVVGEYSEKFEAFLSEFRETVAEKKRLADALAKVEGFLEKARLANVELSNEVAELLVLANIPPSKKEELYSRHITAVKAIEEVTEVIQHDGEEA